MSARKTSPFITKAGGFAFARMERAFVRRSPEKAARLGERLGDLAWRIDKKHRNRTISNLELAMPELTPAKRLEMAREVWRHFGRTTADFLRTEERTRQDVLDSIVEVEGQEHADAAIALDKGVLVITGHFGNWERLAHYLAIVGHPLTVVAREASDSKIEEAMIRKRTHAGANILTRGNTTRQILKSLQEGKSIGLLPDQNCEESFLPFFGKLCGTVLGPAVLHNRTEAPLLPIFCPQVGPNQWKVIYRPMIELPEIRRTPEELMTLVNEELEAVIRRYPTQWLWMHDRWKSARIGGML